MSKFKSKPAELRALPDLPDPEDVARFAAGAETRTVKPTDAASLTTDQRRYKLDKTAKPLLGINLRLNDYERELLKYLADSDQRSIQQTIKRLLIPAAEAAAEIVRSEKGSLPSAAAAHGREQ